MSFRVYPKFTKGNPQLRIFLPNFWMKLMKPATDSPPNAVQFRIPLEMTAVDVENYLEKIYKVPVAQIRLKTFTGDLKKTHKQYLIKEEDYKVAFVTLPKGEKFTFPDLFPGHKKEELSKQEKRLTAQTRDLMKQRRRSWDRGDVPSWFEM